MDHGFQTPKHRDLVYDVGMHKGEDAEFYLRKGFRVVGFEADPDLIRHCRQRLAPFVAAGRLAIVEGAIVGGPVSGLVRFMRNPRSVWGTVVPEWADRNARLGIGSSSEIEVPVVDFCQAIQQHGIPYYMKVDIEGCDMICVETLQRFVERPDYVSLESDKLRFSTVRHEIDALARLGYDAFQAVDQSTLHHLQRPPSPATEGEYVAHVFEAGASGLFGSELPGRWRTRGEILRQYRAIRAGYVLLGDSGIMTYWRFKGAWRLQNLTARLLGRFTGGDVPGWYDTHARHSTAGHVARTSIAFESRKASTKS